MHARAMSVARTLAKDPRDVLRNNEAGGSVRLISALVHRAGSAWALQHCEIILSCDAKMGMCAQCAPWSFGEPLKLPALVVPRTADLAFARGALSERDRRRWPVSLRAIAAFS